MMVNNRKHINAQEGEEVVGLNGGGLKQAGATSWQAMIGADSHIKMVSNNRTLMNQGPASRTGAG